MKPPALLCQPHLERTGRKVLADRVIEGTPFCKMCFEGRPIDSVESLGDAHFGARLTQVRAKRRFVLRFPRQKSVTAPVTAKREQGAGRARRSGRREGASSLAHRSASQNG